TCVMDGVLEDRHVAERRVGHDGAREQLDGLGYDPEQLSALGLVEEGRIAARDLDAAAPGPVEPGEQGGGARLSGAGTSDQRDVLAAPDLQRNAMQDRTALGVPELHITKDDRRLSNPVDAVRNGRRCRLYRQRECAEDPLRRRDTTLDGLPLLAQRRD